MDSNVKLGQAVNAMKYTLIFASTVTDESINTKRFATFFD